jgi:AbrB family looped-hinge helix DNA binding protein
MAPPAADPFDESAFKLPHLPNGISGHSDRMSTNMNALISTKGQIVLPAALRKQDGIVPGQRFEIERLGAGHYVLKRRPPEDNEGLVDWLLACPEKDWFVPIPAESTDML